MKIYIRYFGYFVYLFILWIYARRNPRQVTVKERIGDRTVTRYNWIFALVAVAPLVYLAMTRPNTVGDTGSYRNALNTAPSILSDIPAYVTDMKKDQWFYIMTAIIKNVFGNNSMIYFFIIASLQSVLLLKTLRKYSSNLLISLFIFFAATDYLSYMNNGVRQFVAVCIVFGAAKYIFEKKYIPAVIVALIAAQFHQTALLMIPFIFIVQGEPWNKSTVFILLGALLVVAFVGSFTEILSSMLEETNYSGIVENWTSWEDDGTNPLRVAVYCVPALLSLLGLHYIREANDPVINVCTNMSVISAGLYIISMVTSGIYMGRLPIYVSLFSNCILLPWEIKSIFTKKSSDFIQRAMIVSFLLFYFYQIHIAWVII